MFAGQSGFLKESWERQEQKLVSGLLQKASLFVNVGANVGYYSLLARNLNIKTIAFEPEPMNCELFVRNMKINGFNEDIVLFPVAVGDVPGFADMHGWMDITTLMNVQYDVSKPRKVPVVRLDDTLLGNQWLTGRIVILVDVEGWEYHVLKGAGRMLSLDPKPVWIIEVLPSHADAAASSDQRSDFFSMMHQAGYRSYHIAPDGNLPEFANGQTLPETSLQASNHNFLFADKNVDISNIA